MSVETIKSDILKEINSIPEAQLKELQKLIHQYTVSVKKKKSKQELQALLLRAPIWGEIEENNIKELRKAMDEWPVNSL